MNKLSLCIVGVFGAAAAVSAQGLYNLMPFDDDASESLPLNWTVGANLGYDDNPTPFGTETPAGNKDGQTYSDGFVQVNFVNSNPQTTWDAWARLGVTHYFDPIQTTNPLTGMVVNSEDTFYGLRGGINLMHRVNERLRIRSRNSLGYETEPDFSYGFGPDRRQGQYLRYSTDNSVGYRWSERFGTNTGFRIQGVTYDDVSNEDYATSLLYNEFRYRATPQTVWTAAYRYGFTEDDGGPDSNSQYFLLGAEHQFSPTTVGVIRAGAQLFEPDAGSDTWAPYLEGMLRSQINEQFSLRSFVRYGIEPHNRRIATHNFGMPTLSSLYDDNTVLRVGAQGSYAVSPRLAIFGGGHVIHRSSDDIVLGSTLGLGTPPASFDETTLNLNLGSSVQITDTIYLTGSYNYTNASSDSNLREYDRNRIQLGVQATF